MASTWSQNLKIELITTGEQAGDWGETTNDNFANVLEQAIVGLGNPDFATDADLTISLTDSTAVQAARAYYLDVTSTVVGGLTTTRNLVVPAIEKPYIVRNSTSGSQSIVIKTSAGSGVTIPNGKTVMVYTDGTDVLTATDHIPSLTLGTALPVASGGTGSNTASGARTNLGLGTMATQASSNVAITGGTITGVSISSLSADIAVTDGGTGASTASGARANLNAAVLGANSDITSLSGLTTPLSVAQGGTGSNSSAGAPFALKGANSDITSLSGLTTALSIAQGGTGGTSANAALTNLLPTQTGNSGKVLQTNGTTTSWETVAAGSGVTIQDDTTTNIFRYPAMAAVTSGNITTAYVSNSKLYFNPNTGTLSATVFSGAGTSLTGTGSSFTAGTATNATLASDTSSTACYVAFATAATGSAALKTNSSRLTFNSSTGALSATSFSGAGTGLTGTAANLTAGALSSTLAISGGGTGVTAQPSFSAYATTSQTFSESVFTKATFGSENWDTNNCFASSRFTPTTAGYYQISGVLRFTPGSGTTGSTTVTTLIYKNGTETYRANESTTDAAIYVVAPFCFLIYLNGSTDYVEIYAGYEWFGTGGTNAGLVYDSNALTSFFQANFVRA